MKKVYFIKLKKLIKFFFVNIKFYVWWMWYEIGPNGQSPWDLDDFFFIYKWDLDDYNEKS